MLICKVCEGLKTKLNEITGKVELCPKCKGHGVVEPISEQGKFRKQLLRG